MNPGFERHSSRRSRFALLSVAHARRGILRGGPEIVRGRSPQWSAVFHVRAAISPDFHLAEKLQGETPRITAVSRAGSAFRVRPGVEHQAVS
jgi:hypothetical protein